MDIYIKLFEVLFPVFFVVGIGYYLGKKNPPTTLAPKARCRKVALYCPGSFFSKLRPYFSHHDFSQGGFGYLEQFKATHHGFCPGPRRVRSVGRHLDYLLPIGHENPVVSVGFDRFNSRESTERGQYDPILSDLEAGGTEA